MWQQAFIHHYLHPWHWTGTPLQAMYLNRATAVHFIYCFSVLIEWQLKRTPPGASAKPDWKYTSPLLLLTLCLYSPRSFSLLSMDPLGAPQEAQRSHYSCWVEIQLRKHINRFLYVLLYNFNSTAALLWCSQSVVGFYFSHWKSRVNNSCRQ